MEDIEKYIFDPENPKGFKAYKLLLKIIRDDNFLVFVDPIFYVSIYYDKIFNKKVIAELWDKPSNFEELDLDEKIEIYIKNFSEKDFSELVYNASLFVSPPNIYDNIFKEFINELKFEFENFNMPPSLNCKISNSIWIDINNYRDALSQEIPSHFGYDLELEKNIADKNVILFLSKKYFPLLNSFPLSKTSVVVTTKKDFNLGIEDESLNHNSKEILPKPIKPIIIKNYLDLNLLFDFINRDLTKKNKLTQEFKSFKLKSFSLSNYFSLKKVEIKQTKSNEVYFLGENGDGKTLLLQAILLSLVGNKNIGLISEILKGNFNVNQMSLVSFDIKNRKFEFQLNPKSQKNTYSRIFAYGVNRFRNDSDKKDQHGFLTLFSHNEYLENPVKWLQHLDYQEKSDNQPDIPLEKAKKLLNELLEENVQIEVSPNGVGFYERGTKLKFEQLSDGYKSVLVWVCDLLSRLAAKQPNVEHISDFHGIVLVDEIGMFLHPKWQRTIVKKLRATFPNIQFFFTTHSPIVLLGASEDAVFYKVYKEDGETKVSDPIENKPLGHLMANGIITAPFLFGLESARSESYDPETDNLDTSDDYLSGKIHDTISKKIAQKNNISEDQIMDLIQTELDKYEAQTND